MSKSVRKPNPIPEQSEFETTNNNSSSSKRGKKKRPYPVGAFEESIAFCKALYDLASGEKVRRLTLFDEIKKSPDSSASRMLITNSNKYGLTKGSYQSEFLELTPKGLKAVSDDNSPYLSLTAKFELAISEIDVYNFIYNKYAGNKLPALAGMIDLIKDNFKDKGIDSEDAHAIVETFIVNIKYLGLLLTISGAERIVTIEHALEKLPVPAVVEANVQNNTIDLIPIGTNLKEIQSYDSYDNVCFYITPIGSDDSEQRMHSNLFLESIITPAIEQFKLKVVRADQIDKPGTITNQIIEYIFKSKLVVADLSFHNPNVFYELALRHTCRLPTVQIIRKADYIPFDLSQSRTVIIDTTDIYSLVPKLETYKAEIAGQIRQALSNADYVDNPITNVFPKVKVTLN